MYIFGLFFVFHHVEFIIPMALIQLEALSDTVRVGFPAF